MQRIMNQTSSFEKWTPDPQSPDEEVDCKICFASLLENPDSNLFAEITPEVVGHRQNNKLIHKIHNFCLQRWIIQNPTLITEQNTMPCPAGCFTQINCDQLGLSQKAFADFKNQMTQRYLTLCLGCGIITFSALMYFSYPSKVSLGNRVAILSAIGVTLVKKQVDMWNRIYLPVYFDQYRDLPAMKEELSSWTIYSGITDGLLVSVAMISTATFMDFFGN